jgi:hypothetical protein
MLTLGNKDKPEPHLAVAVISRHPKPASRPQVQGVIKPTAAANHMEGKIVFN